MSKRSFNEIEQAIRNAAEAHEPAFDEQSWEKMEALLDKEKDRRRPVFWLWWLLLPILIGTGVTGYFIFTDSGNKNKQQEITAKKDAEPANKNIKSNTALLPEKDIESRSTNNNDRLVITTDYNNNDRSLYVPVTANNKKNKPASASADLQTGDEKINSRKNLNDKVNGKVKATITAAAQSVDIESNETLLPDNEDPEKSETIVKSTEKTEEIVVIKVDADKTPEKKIEKIVDSVVEKIRGDKKTKSKNVRLYIIAAGGAEASGVKLFSADKVTGRAGLGLGYQLNKNLSVQTGFYVSNKKYGAKGGDYKTKPGSYWSIVDIQSIEANCKVYEIPLSVIYNFTPGKKLGIFASAGLSSYIMKREDYRFYYEHYGMAQQADAYYKGNKNLFSVLRLSAGIEKKIASRFSVIASPGVAIPLSGIGDGEVKLYSYDFTIGVKFTPFQKK